MLTLGLNEYQAFTVSSNRVPIEGTDGARFACLGLFGEVGSLLSVAKKNRRDVGAFYTYSDELVEELGDSLWYFTNLSHRLGLTLEEVGTTTARPNNPEKLPLTFFHLQTATVIGDDAALLEAPSRLRGLGRKSRRGRGGGWWLRAGGVSTAVGPRSDATS